MRRRLGHEEATQASPLHYRSSRCAPRKRPRFHLLDERILAIHIRLHVVWMRRREGSLQIRILFRFLSMRPHEVTERPVPQDVWRAMLERVKLMRSRARFVVSSKIAPSRDAELTHCFVSQGFHRGIALI